MISIRGVQCQIFDIRRAADRIEKIRSEKGCSECRILYECRIIYVKRSRTNRPPRK